MTAQHLSPLWTPRAERIAQANITAFMAREGQSDFEALHAWSLADQGAFQTAVWEFFGVVGVERQVARINDAQAGERVKPPSVGI